jgi:hypothetical protein
MGGIWPLAKPPFDFLWNGLAGLTAGTLDGQRGWASPYVEPADLTSDGSQIFPPIDDDADAIWANALAGLDRTKPFTVRTVFTVTNPYVIGDTWPAFLFWLGGTSSHYLGVTVIYGAFTTNPNTVHITITDGSHPIQTALHVPVPPGVPSELLIQVTPTSMTLILNGVTLNSGTTNSPALWPTTDVITCLYGKPVDKEQTQQAFDVWQNHS